MVKLVTKRSLISSFVKSIRTWDYYGQPITLKYNGNESFQTLPGALLSIMARIILFGYVLFKGSGLLMNTDWIL